MRFPGLKIPNLVTFNHRVHRRLDPLFARKWVRRGAWALFAGLMLMAVVFVVFARNIPSSEKLLAYQPPLPSNVRGYDGNPVQTFARERRVELAYDEYPELVVEAFISAEDKTFFSHGGIDYPGLVGAVFDYTTKALTGGRAKGGSTITQQVAKYLLQDDEYAISRKIRE
ncbi:MAG: transglycosylase domain-containing protein, partial [Sphingomonas sp.]|nr:transglycosylase domain-containing protein [Sphingomonas sp.]